MERRFADELIAILSDTDKNGHFFSPRGKYAEAINWFKKRFKEKNIKHLILKFREELIKTSKYHIDNRLIQHISKKSVNLVDSSFKAFEKKLSTFQLPLNKMWLEFDYREFGTMLGGHDFMYNSDNAFSIMARNGSSIGILVENLTNTNSLHDDYIGEVNRSSLDALYNTLKMATSGNLYRLSYYTKTTGLGSNGEGFDSSENANMWYVLPGHGFFFSNKPMCIKTFIKEIKKFADNDYVDFGFQIKSNDSEKELMQKFLQTNKYFLSEFIGYRYIKRVKLNKNLDITEEERMAGKNIPNSLCSHFIPYTNKYCEIGTEKRFIKENYEENNKVFNYNCLFIFSIFISTLDLLNYHQDSQTRLMKSSNIKGYKLKGSNVPRNEYRIIDVNLPKDTPVKKLQSLLSKGYKLPKHTRRGHYKRRYPMRPGNTELIWIDAYEAGDEKYGTIKHGYRLQ